MNASSMNSYIEESSYTVLQCGRSSKPYMPEYILQPWNPAPFTSHCWRLFGLVNHW